MTPSRYRKVWTATEDTILAHTVIAAQQQGRSLLDGCTSAAIKLERTDEAVKSRWRALNQTTAYFTRERIKDTGVRVKGLTVIGATTGVVGKRVPSGRRSTPASPLVTVWMDGREYRGTTADLRALLRD